MFKSTRWSHRFLTVSAALPLPDLIVGVENVTSVSVKDSLIRVPEVCPTFPLVLNEWHHLFLCGQ